MIEGGAEEGLQGQGGHCLVQARAGDAGLGEARRQRRGPGQAVLPSTLEPQFSHLQDGLVSHLHAVGLSALHYCPLKEAA